MINSVAELIQELYKLKTTPVENPVIAAVGTTAVLVLSSNPRRFSFTFINLSSNIIYISPNTEVSATRGIYVAPNGGFLSLNYIDDMELVTHDWYAVATAAASEIYVLENNMYGSVR